MSYIRVDNLMAPLHPGRKTPGGLESNVALTGDRKQAATFRACAAAERAKASDPGTAATNALIETAHQMREALEATYPNN